VDQLWQLTEQNSELSIKPLLKDHQVNLLDYSSSALEQNIEDMMNRLNNIKSDIREDIKIDS